MGGQTRKVLMQAPKNGFFFVVDRTNGKLINAGKFINGQLGRTATTSRPGGLTRIRGAFLQDWQAIPRGALGAGRA